MLAWRTGLLVLAAFVLGAALRCLWASFEWLDRPFMGFLMGRNHIAAPIGQPHWTGFTAGVPFGSPLVTVEGAPAAPVTELVERTWAMPVGTPVRYGFQTSDGVAERTVAVMPFGFADWAALFGVWVSGGMLFLLLGFAVAYVKPWRPASVAMLIFGIAWGLTLLLSLGDFHRFHFRSLYAWMQALAAPALLVVALTFPDRPLPRRWPLLLVGLGAIVVGQATTDVWLYDRAPVAWMRFFEGTLVWLAVAAIAACAIAWRRYRDAPVDDRVRLRMVGVGALLSFGLPAVVQLVALVAGVTLPINMPAIATTLFPLVVAYAALKHDLLQLDPVVTRSVFYAVLTTIVTGGWVAILGIAQHLPPAPLVHDGMPFLFTAGVAALVAPLRRGVQTSVDHFFFRTRYDAEATMEAASRSLTASLDQGHIATSLRRTLDETVAPAPSLLLLADADGALRDDVGTTLPGDDPRLAGADQIVAVDDGPLHARGVRLLVAMRAEDRLEGVLALGAKRSGAPYGARDLLVLRTLANQSAIALRNAASYASLRDLTATLEERVAARTADLARTHDALLQTQQQLARADKLASLGRLVAGVAHEINNPVAFVNSAVDLIQTAAERVRAGLAPDADPALHGALDQLLENTAICRDGAARAARIVRDLTAFARNQHARREPVDLAAACDRSLQLLRGELRDRITVVRDYGAVPRPLANPGEIDQVLMNLLANAAQAIPDRGEIRLRTWAEDDSVCVTVSDSGRGIPPEIQERIFEPFFTTKDGQGTGLGLAIAHSVVHRHGGDLALDSAPGRGTTFLLRLPLAPPPPSPDAT